MLHIRNHETGAVEPLARDVRARHSDWVHRQLGTRSESDLQHALDQMSIEEFAAHPGAEDEAGIFVPADAP